MQKELDNGLAAFKDNFVVYLSVCIQCFRFWNNPALKYRSDVLGSC